MVRDVCIWFMVVWVCVGEFMDVVGMYLGYVDCCYFGYECDWVYCWCYVIDGCFFEIKCDFGCFVLGVVWDCFGILCVCFYIGYLLVY